MDVVVAIVVVTLIIVGLYLARNVVGRSDFTSQLQYKLAPVLKSLKEKAETGS